MPCYHPLKGYRARTRNPSGKYSLVFSPSEGYVDQPITVPCGGCIGCRLDYARQWAIRCMHEASLYENNIFLTLTYNGKHLPFRDKNGVPSMESTLRKDDFQNFMKRLRKRTSGFNKVKKELPDGRIIYPRPIRYFHCGEYGEKFGRPHYHALIFNFDFRDKYYWRKSPCGTYRIYRSKTLEELWPYGFAEIGSVTFQSAGYVARYVVKKQKGKSAEDHYNRYREDTGEALSFRQPEYVTMSRRPGIGKGWLEKYKDDVYPHDFTLVDGKKWKPPRFYDNQLDEKELAKVKGQRRKYAKSDSAVFNSTPHRRITREAIKENQMKMLKKHLS